MEEQKITFKTAELAKEKGFDEPCKTYYSKMGKSHSSKQKLTHKSLRSGGCLKPTQSILQKWLREKINIDLFVVPAIKANHYEWLLLYELGSGVRDEIEADQSFIIYEDALERGLQIALKHI